MGNYSICNKNINDLIDNFFPIDRAFEINQKQANFIIYNRKPLGNFYKKEKDGVFIGIDNSTGESFVEEFKDKETCIAWLTNKNITYFTELDYGKTINELKEIKCNNNSFEVIITEELVTAVTVKAKNKEEALNKVRGMYSSEQIVLNSDDLNDVHFKVDYSL